MKSVNKDACVISCTALRSR